MGSPVSGAVKAAALPGAGAATITVSGAGSAVVEVVEEAGPVVLVVDEDVLVAVPFVVVVVGFAFARRGAVVVVEVDVDVVAGVTVSTQKVSGAHAGSTTNPVNNRTDRTRTVST
jgi:hypothetical protein